MCNFHDLYYAEDYAAFTCWFIKDPSFASYKHFKGVYKFCKGWQVNMCYEK